MFFKKSNINPKTITRIDYIRLMAEAETMQELTKLKITEIDPEGYPFYYNAKNISTNFFFKNML